MSDEIQLDSVPEMLGRMPARRKKKNKKRNRKWSSDLNAVEIGPFLFIPLTCTKALRDEGYAMEHCVRTYEELCRLDYARIFSVRDAMTMERVATLSLIWEDDYWHLDQIKGMRNVEVVCQELTHFDGEQTVTEIFVADVHYAAMELVQRYREAWLNN
jgi:hypothetical protein